LSASTEPQALALSFQIQPNPIVDGIVQVQINNTANTEALCQIYDQNGRLVQTETIQIVAGDVRHSFNVSDLPPGIYALRLQSNHSMEWQSQRFVVAR
jgi:hypothetical protein